jgi:hypothetical protein
MDTDIQITVAAPGGDPDRCGGLVGVSCSTTDNRGQTQNGAIINCSPNVTLPPAPAPATGPGPNTN